jgi:hypothetical protein
MAYSTVSLPQGASSAKVEEATVRKFRLVSGPEPVKYTLGAPLEDDQGVISVVTIQAMTGNDIKRFGVNLLKFRKSKGDIFAFVATMTDLPEEAIGAMLAEDLMEIYEVCKTLLPKQMRRQVEQADAQANEEADSTEADEESEKDEEAESDRSS